jgi:hypothetical protein
VLVVSAAAREIKESARKLLEEENSRVLLADLSVCFAETIFRMNISNMINCFLEMVSYDPSGVAAYSTVEENTAAKALHDYLQQLLSQCNATSSALQDHVCDSADMLLDAPPFQSANEILFPKANTGRCSHWRCKGGFFIRCSWCDNDFCFSHFFVKYHKHF